MNDQRKHRIQMTPQETIVVESFIPTPRRWNILQHARERMIEKGFTIAELARVLRTGQVIEVHQNNWPEIRAVVRLNTVCLAVSLTTFHVITVWWNATHDNHSTLNLSNYKWHSNLLKVLELKG